MLNQLLRKTIKHIICSVKHEHHFQIGGITVKYFFKFTNHHVSVFFLSGITLRFRTDLKHGSFFWHTVIINYNYFNVDILE